MNDNLETSNNADLNKSGNAKCSAKQCNGKTGRRIFFTIALVVATVMIIGALQGCFGMGRHGSGHGWCATEYSFSEKAKKIVSRTFDKVDATDEQQLKASSIIDAHADAFKVSYNSFKGHREETMKLLASETIDRTALENLRQEKVKAVDNISREMVDIVAEIAEVLTPEQRAELAKLHKDHKGRWGHEDEKKS